MKQTLVYGQQSCRLQLEGFPDVSAGHAPDALGIITSWTLDWAGRPPLEGQRDHLAALVNVVLPYARYLMSGVSRPFGTAPQPVEISPAGPGQHRLVLRSSQPGVSPLEVQLDSNGDLRPMPMAMRAAAPAPAPPPFTAAELPKPTQRLSLLARFCAL